MPMFDPSFDLTLSDSYARGLACAAISTGLRSILVFDAPYIDFETSANILVQMLECANGEEVELVHLGVSELDDNLWGTIILPNDVESSPIVWQRGALAGLADDNQKSKSPLRVVVIPDLSKLSLAAARACVMLMGADVAYLERHGQHKTFQPNVCWLVGCARDEIGAISPHLLDRFAIRLSWQDAENPYDTVASLRQKVENDNVEDIKIPLPQKVRDKIQEAMQVHPVFTDEAKERVAHYTSKIGTYLTRREIALARLAVATARLEGASQVLASYVDDAANILGFMPPTQQSNETPQLPEDRPTIKPDLNPNIPVPGSISEAPETSPLQPENVNDGGTIYDSNQTDSLEAALVAIDPYPEDTAAVERESTSLRLPQIQYSTASPHRGAVIGVERTSTLKDLAVLSTLFAAAPYQAYRREQKGVTNGSLLLSETDLRSYRRAPAAEQMLLILLDYTSMRDCDWQQALLPYLRDAYTARASIGIVQVGASNAVNLLQAELVSARSVLVPSIGAALDAQPGRATPLAHGFDLALRTLRHALQHGRSTVQQAVFVVISDGRGNVPLKVSRKEGIVGSIKREGIEDALQMARLIRDLNHVRTVLLNPQPKQYPDLPTALANVLGAEVQNIPPLLEEEG
jgi:magnesium chelatase subunit D